MPNKRDSAKNEDIHEFLDDVIGTDYRKVEEDLGDGYVRLCTSEADRRQAAQDIRSSEDILIEMLRNSRDAGAKNIYIATQKLGDIRSICIIDDGQGIPEPMHEQIFQPRVTSKLDSAHLDRWGMHGRGMALFSIATNSEKACVEFSGKDRGCSIHVDTDTTKLGEKRDQSTFPHFEIIDEVHAMRGPKNILRTACEFAIEHGAELSVYCGSYTEIAATIWASAIKEVPASMRAFSNGEVRPDSISIPHSFAMCFDPDAFAGLTELIGIPISARSARRIYDGEITPLTELTKRIQEESFLSKSNNDVDTQPQVSLENAKFRMPRISQTDLDEVVSKAQGAFSAIAHKYYLKDTPLEIRQRDGRIYLEFKMVEKD